MDITLPNGTVITGIPEGTPKHAVAMKAIQNGLATNADFGYDEVKQDKATFMEGMGAGFMNTGRRVGNLLGMDNEKAIANQAEIDQNLGGMGQFGKLAGEVAATAPIGGAVGAGGKALGRTLLAARRAGSVGKAPARALANTLKSRTGRGALEGGAFGTVMADPGERDAGAVLGAGIGGVAGKLGKMAGAAGRKMKLTDISDEAKAVQKLTGHHIPLSQSAKPGTVRMIYNAFLANVPGVGSKYRAKYDAALQDFRHYVSTKAHPDNSTARVDIPKNATMGDIFEELSNYWKTAYDPIKAELIGVFKKHWTKPPDFLEKEVQKIARGRIKLPVPGEVTTGKNILDLKNLINNQILPKEAPIIQQELKAYVKSLDDLIEANFKPGSKNRHIYDDYLDLREPYRNWIDLQKAAAKATGAEFSASQLAKSAQRGTQGLPTSQQTVLQKAAEMGSKTLEDFPSRQGLFQGAAALGLGVSALAGVGAPVAAGMAGIVGLGKAMTTEGFEKLISGQTQLMKTYARQLRASGYTGRQIAAAIGIGEQNAP